VSLESLFLFYAAAALCGVAVWDALGVLAAFVARCVRRELEPAE